MLGKKIPPCAGWRYGGKDWGAIRYRMLAWLPPASVSHTTARLTTTEVIFIFWRVCCSGNVSANVPTVLLRQRLLHIAPTVKPIPWDNA